MLSNAIWTAWISWQQRKRRQRKSDANREQRRSEMRIKVMSVFVDDQEKALRFYTEVLGFVKKTDFSQGPYGWLLVAPPEDKDETNLRLPLTTNRAPKLTSRRSFNKASP